jgi:hypothetical protein
MVIGFVEKKVLLLISKGTDNHFEGERFLIREQKALVARSGFPNRFPKSTNGFKSSSYGVYLFKVDVTANKEKICRTYLLSIILMEQKMQPLTDRLLQEEKLDGYRNGVMLHLETGCL